MEFVKFFTESRQSEHSNDMIDTNFSLDTISKEQLKTRCKELKFHDHTISNYLMKTKQTIVEIKPKTVVEFFNRYKSIRKLPIQPPILFIWDYYDRQFHIIVSIKSASYIKWGLDYDDSITAMCAAENALANDKDFCDNHWEAVVPIILQMPILPIMIFEKKDDGDGVIITDWIDYLFYKDWDMGELKSSLGVNILHCRSVIDQLEEFRSTGGIIKPYVWYFVIRKGNGDNSRLIIMRDHDKSPKMRFK